MDFLTEIILVIALAGLSLALAIGFRQQEKKFIQKSQEPLSTLSNRSPSSVTPFDQALEKAEKKGQATEE